MSLQPCVCSSQYSCEHHTQECGFGTYECHNHFRECHDHTHTFQHHILRVEITLVRVESHLCVSKSHCVWKLHSSANRNHNLLEVSKTEYSSFVSEYFKQFWIKL
jgi:hypothetical protein